MGYNLLINGGVYWGCNPLTNLLLSSWDIQVERRERFLFRCFFSFVVSLGVEVAFFSGEVGCAFPVEVCSRSLKTQSGIFHDGSIKVNEDTQILSGAGVFSYIWVVQGKNVRKVPI